MRKIGIVLILGFLLFPSFSNALGSVSTCSKDGYTIATLNGIFVGKDGAEKNLDKLRKTFGPDWSGQGIDYEYFLNESHLGGIGDAVKAVEQKVFDTETVDDYDLAEILKSASEKVKTQKLLLVGHSQGNFYANSFYKKVADQSGGVPTKSIGIYSVATPSGYVAGGGDYLTSKTDNVIAGIVAKVPFRKILPPNDDITEVASSWITNPTGGHDFREVYLEYRGEKIVSAIESSLGKLQTNDLQKEDKPCIDPPELGLIHEVQKIAFAVADPVAEKGVGAVVGTVKFTNAVGVVVAETGTKAITAIGALTMKGTALAAAGVSAVGNFTIRTASATVSVAASVGKSAVKTIGAVFENASGQTAGAALSVQKPVTDNQLPVTNNTTTAPTTNNQTPRNNNQTSNNQEEPDSRLRGNDKTEKEENPPSSATRTPARHTSVVVADGPPLAKEELRKDNLAENNQTPRNNNQTGDENRSTGPKIIYLGSAAGGFGGGGEKPKTLAAVVPSEILQPGTSLDAPVVSVSECSSSLATDGCLIATTTVRFSWPAVSGADHYALNLDGEFVTTADNELEITAPDFSDFTLAVAAVPVSDSALNASATTTTAVSVASIPIAINEIAWMGTAASTTDEWLELKNNTTHTIDLSNWILASASGSVHIVLSGTLAPRGYIVLENTDDTSTSVAAHATYSGLLADAGEQLTLSRSSTVFDTTPSGAWAGGDSAGRKTMERFGSKESGVDAGNWDTNLEFISNGTDALGGAMSGTPAARNSVSYLINKGNDISGAVSLTSGDGYYVIVDDSAVVTTTGVLSIGAGVVIKFYGSEFQVVGRLKVEGTASNPVVFEPFDPDDKTRELIFSGSTGTSTIAYAQIKNIEAVRLTDGAHVAIRDSEFVDNDSGLNLTGGSLVTIDRTSFASTTEDVIVADEGSSVIMRSSSITDVSDGDAIVLYGGSRLSLASSTIDNVQDGDGIYLDKSTATIASSTIKNILDGDGIILDRSTATITNSAIGDILNGDGIDTYKSTTTITGSTISNILDGDGVATYNGTTTITNSTVSGIFDGDAIYADSSKLSVASSTISGLYYESGGALALDSTVSIASTTITNAGGGDSVKVFDSTLSVSSSTIANTSEGSGIEAYDSASTISNTTVTGSAIDDDSGIYVGGGTATITNSTVSGFEQGIGVNIYSPETPVIISGTEVTGNDTGVFLDNASSVTISADSSIHDNGENIVMD